MLYLRGNDDFCFLFRGFFLKIFSMLLFLLVFVAHRYWKQLFLLHMVQWWEIKWPKTCALVCDLWSRELRSCESRKQRETATIPTDRIAKVLKRTKCYQLKKLEKKRGKIPLKIDRHLKSTTQILTVICVNFSLRSVRSMWLCFRLFRFHFMYWDKFLHRMCVMLAFTWLNKITLYVWHYFWVCAHFSQQRKRKIAQIFTFN